MNNVTENTKVIYVGIDVHKDTNSFCAYDSREDKLFAEHKSSSKFENTLHYLKNLQKSVGQDAVFLIGYEAGPTGYGLCRKLQKEGFACVIIAPSTIAKAPGQKVKTDRMDARLLAKTLAFKTYSPVCLPSEKLEAIKEYTRVRTAKITMLKKAKQNLLSFLLRMGLPYPQGGHYWTQAHMAWLRTVNFADKWLQESFEEYHAEVITLMDKVQRIEAKILELCKDDEVREKIDALVCISGISYVSAISIVAEIGDFSRFSKAKSFVSFIGLCPGEDSSGNRVRHTAITKAGNSRVRSLLVECAGSLRMHSVVTAKSVRVKERQKNASAAIVSYADKCTLRLRKRMLYLSQKGLPYNLVTTAGARELACFVWGMMNLVDNRKTALNKIDEGELSDIQKTVGEFSAQ